MKVSVIIPVYNAARYVEKAVTSALDQPETGEVLLIEDGSSDGSLQVCERLAETLPRVKLFRHSGGENRGPAASRNRGILEAQCEFISFLDADDIYLPGRYEVAARIFAENPSVDGVYEATGTHFADESAERRWREQPLHCLGPLLVTLRESVPPEHLFEVLLKGHSGGPNTDGIVVRRRLFEKTGLFDECLLHHEDPAMWLKMAAVGRLVAGRIDDPVSLRLIHDNNMTWQLTGSYDPYLKEFWERMCLWGMQAGLSHKRMGLLRYYQWRARFLGYSQANQRKVYLRLREGPRFIHVATLMKYVLVTIISRPSLVFSKYFLVFVRKNSVRVLQSIVDSPVGQKTKT